MEIIVTILLSILVLAVTVKRYRAIIDLKEAEIIFLTGKNIELKEDVARKEHLLSDLRDKCSGLIAKNRNQKSQISHNEKQLKIQRKEKESIMKQVRQLEKLQDDLETDYDNLRYVLERTERDLEVSHELGRDAINRVCKKGQPQEIEHSFKEDKDRFADVLESRDAINRVCTAGFDAEQEAKSCVSMK